MNLHMCSGAGLAIDLALARSASAAETKVLSAGDVMLLRLHRL